MNICEEFVSIQGEGKYIGTPSFFIRTVGCNLRCTWKNKDGSITKCDTEYTSFNIEQSYKFNIDYFEQNFIKKYPNIYHIVITGGEPLLQSDIQVIIKQLLEKRNFIITIETNGTIYNTALTKVKNNILMSFSPKLQSSYNSTGTNLKLHIMNNSFFDNIKQYINKDNFNYQIKYVVNEDNDFYEIIKYSLPFDKNNIYLMPQGIEQTMLTYNLQNCVDFCIEHGYNITDRLQIRIWGNKRKT